MRNTTTSPSGIIITTDVQITATITLSEGDLRALAAMTAYGANAFLKAFYIKLGTTSMKPFERDLRGLFERINSTVPKALRSVQAARAELGIKP